MWQAQKPFLTTPMRAHKFGSSWTVLVLVAVVKTPVNLKKEDSSPPRPYGRGL